MNNQDYALPGVGAFVAAAVEQGQLDRVWGAILAMPVMVLGTNFLFWRPLVAWAEKFRQEDTAAAEKPRSLVLDTLRRPVLPHAFARAAAPIGRALDTLTRPFGLAEHPLHTPVLARGRPTRRNHRPIIRPVRHLRYPQRSMTAGTSGSCRRGVQPK